MKIMDNLGKDETLVTQGKVHWACLIPHILLCVVLIGFLTIWGAVIRMFTTELVLTNKRIYGKVGLINTKTLDTPLNKINTISVSNGLFGKIFGYGTLHITSSSGEYLLKGIKSPNVFRDSVMSEIDRFDEARIKKQASEMAAAIKG